MGETGKRKIEYYINEGKLIFAFEQNFEYNRPIYWNEKTAKENGDTELYDSRKTRVQEDRFYFHDEKMFLWLDNEKEEINLRIDANAMIGQKLIADYYEVKDKLKN